MKIGSRVDQVGGNPAGYDHNFVINGQPGTLRLGGRVTDPKTGRVLEFWTTQPAVQLYTGNFLDGSVKGISGKPYKRHDALCLETQHFPDSPNHPDFPTTTLKPGETFTSTTVYKFSSK
jgi:aldose 1-epimerase